MPARNVSLHALDLLGWSAIGCLPGAPAWGIPREPTTIFDAPEAEKVHRRFPASGAAVALPMPPQSPSPVAGRLRGWRSSPPVGRRTRLRGSGENSGPGFRPRSIRSSPSIRAARGRGPIPQGPAHAAARPRTPADRWPARASGRSRSRAKPPDASARPRPDAPSRSNTPYMRKDSSKAQRSSLESKQRIGPALGDRSADQPPRPRADPAAMPREPSDTPPARAVGRRASGPVRPIGFCSTGASRPRYCISQRPRRDSRR